MNFSSLWVQHDRGGRTMLLAVMGFAAGLAFCSVGTSYAAEPPAPVSIDPGQLEKRFETPPEPRAMPKAVIPETAAPLPPDEASRIRFELKAIEVEGATVFSPDDFRPLYRELLNREVSLLDIYQLAGKVTALYGNSGYILSRAIVPPQTISDGVVKLRAVEGYVDQVVFEGKPSDRTELFDYFAERIRASRPLRASVLERYLLLANDLAGVRAQSVLRPSTDASGAATLVLDVRTQRYEGVLSVDNRGTEAVGPTQVYLELRGNSLFHRYEQTALRIATTPDDTKELAYAFVGETLVLNGEGTQVGFNLTYSGSEPGTEFLRMLEVESSSRSAEIALLHPLVRARNRNLTLTAALGYRSSISEILGTTNSEDRQYVFRGGAIYDQADAFGGVNLFALTLNQGIDAFDAQIESRQDAPAGFTSLELRASRQQQLSEQWLLTLRVAGQAAGNSLPSSELFGLGGETFGRGYDPSEWVGDQGAAASVEIAHRTSFKWAALLKTYAFYDYGVVWRRVPVSEPDEQWAASTGAGVQAGMAKGISLSLEAAKPLGERASSEDTDDWRLFGRVAVSF